MYFEQNFSYSSLMGLQRKIFDGNRANAYFATHNWNFINDNFINLCSFLRLEDIKDFEFRDSFTYDMILASRTVLLGYRRYLMKEKDESIPACQKHYRRLQLATNAARFLIYSIFAYLIFFKYRIVDVIQNQFDLWMN